MASRKLAVGNPPGAGALRLGGTSVASVDAITGPAETRDLPSTRSKASALQQAALTICRDLYAGPGKVRERAGEYLPQAPGEDADSYAIRLKRSAFFNVFGDAVQGLVAFMYRKDPKMGDDVPAVIQQHAENIDLAGTHLDAFLSDLTIDAMVAGHAAILVDYPDTSGADIPRLNGNPTREAERRFRPYWIPLQKEDLLSWRTTLEDGKTVLTQLVVRECQMVPDGAFGEKEQERYRVLARDLIDGVPVVTFRVLMVTEKREVIEVASGVYRNQVEIPVAEVPTSGRVGLFVSRPPLESLAYLNIAHYQAYSDDAYSRYKTCVPIYAESGADPVPQGQESQRRVIGPNTGVRFTSPQAKAYYVSHDGQALAACKAALDDLKSDMAVLGLAMLAPQKRAAETAAAKKLDKGASDSKLAVTARGVQDGVERALGFHARYLGLESGGSIEINRDFENMVMDAPTMVAWGQLATALSLPPRVVIEALVRGEQLPEDTDVLGLEAEILSAQLAAQEQQALAQKAQIVKLGGGLTAA